MRSACSRLALVLALLAPAMSSAGTRLFAPHAGATALPGIADASRLAIDPAGLAAIRQARTSTVDAFPLGRAQTAALIVEQFDPLAGARIDVVGPAGVRQASRPALTFLRGTIDGDPSAVVVLTIDADSVRGLIIGAHGTTVVGPDANGRHHAWVLEDIDQDVHTPPKAFCLNDLRESFPATSMLARPSDAFADAPPVGGLVTLRRADVAVETDQEFRAKFATDSDALAYLATLFAEASAIYTRDLALELNLSYVRLWTTADPWNASAPDGQLDELQDHWNDPVNDMDTLAGPRAVVHMLSGKPVQGGIAYIDAACNTPWMYAVSQVYGDFDSSNPNDVWDLTVFMHELGHNIGSHHTHCYSPAIDTCFSGEPGCYAGPETASQGTVMSYCHLHPGGLSNIDLRFHERVQEQIAATTTTYGCLVDVGTLDCGNELVDGDETCDDGNRTSGDGCSANCQLEVCGNGIIDLGEVCDDGNVDDGDGCTAACTLEVCGDGVLHAGEACDDGNLDAGDGCSPTCTTERCAILIPHQQIWQRAKVLVRPGLGASARLSLRGTFEMPSASLDLATTGISIAFEDTENATTFEVAIPGGPDWLIRGGRARYRDPAGTHQGVRKITIRTRDFGPHTSVRFAVNAAGGAFPESADELPARLTVLLGDETASTTGTCGQWIPRIGACRSIRGGKRLLCR